MCPLIDHRIFSMHFTIYFQSLAEPRHFAMEGEYTVNRHTKRKFYSTKSRKINLNDFHVMRDINDFFKFHQLFKHPQKLPKIKVMLLPSFLVQL